MRTLTVDCVSVFGLMIAYNTVIAGDGVRMENDVFRDTLDTFDDDTVDNVTEPACDIIATNPTPCPCQCLNDRLLCCNIDNPYPLPKGQCDSYNCSATEITLLNCQLHSTVINRQFILSLGWRQSRLRTLRLRNCSISDTTFGSGLEGLRVLDLRGNKVDAFREPEVEMLDSIYLSGGHYIICYLYYYKCCFIFRQ